ncbi:Actin-like protein arp9 (SWI/SNF complex component arp9) [Ascosphaera atra]|nr:Actin-like protein arp9 (SWI/SNF complex component arp9) [Ascosphaera atra]
MIAQPCWTTRDREVITQFVFEKLKAPAFCMIDSALAVCYAYGVSTATVIDVGHGKVDVTAVTDFVVQDYGRGIALEKCGGEAMTERLFELLQSKGFSRKMCDQLKRSSICEVLSEETPMPGQETASLSPAGEKESPKPGEGAEKPKQGGEDDDEGVLDVAAIVTGNTTEILAQKEREKAEALAAKKGAAAEAMAKTMRLPNSKRETNFFTFQEYISEKDESGIDVFTLHSKEVEVGQERFMALTPSESKDPERLMFGILETIAAQVHRTISCVPDMSKRGELWDSFIIVGNGSRIKGFNQALISTLTQKYLLTPSTGTIFTNDVPTQFPTPAGTVGTNTPANVNTPNPYLVAATSSANNPTTITVNPNDPNQARGSHPSQTPLSIKAVKAPEYFPEFKVGAAASAGLAGAGAANVPAPTGAAAATNAAPANAPGAAGSVASQAAGFEEAVFLGAQVAAKLVFMIDQGVSKGFLNRDDYNELGPSAIHDCTL